MSNTGYFHYWMRTQVHCAAGALVRVPALLQQLGGKRVLLLGSAGVRRAGLLERLEAVFAANRGGGQAELAGVIECIESGVSAAAINQALARARELGTDCIVALGGGSVQDVAKAVKYALAHGLADIQDALLGGIRLETSPPEGLLGIPHIAIPTLAGGGAEVSNTAVIRCERLGGLRALLRAPGLEADIAVLDPQLTVGLSRSLTAAAGMEALAQALEVVASTGSNHLSDANAFAAVALIDCWLEAVVNEPGNLDGHGALLQASTLSGVARTNVLGAMPVHNCACALASLYDIPLGQLKGALLPVVLEVLRDFYRPVAWRLARAFGIPTTGRSADETLDQVIARLRILLDEIGMPWAIPGLPQGEMERIVQAVSVDPAAMFCRMSPAQIEAIIAKVAGT
ncbi:iron-containing alcohol dehydrogenase [Zestomonas carbonaria]|uniref:Long-chain-alcohol dehydrogenase 1 n=1 Tax=Zestomonas carbonaria TaxID=2762745 RepID=A0A7U7IBV1_9GAMM|nr:iron-containing alcohol dehydrogenase [Pseudomonas carbonaria]CAD5109377.1 Long-chain-alcohol dehydrogenase 1 [Pseudomonas carbonaria]